MNLFQPAVRHRSYCWIGISWAGYLCATKRRSETYMTLGGRIPPFLRPCYSSSSSTPSSSIVTMAAPATHASEFPSNPDAGKHQINLIRGWPNPSLLPTDLLSSAAQRNLADPSIYIPALQYGADAGYQPLREALATWLSEHYRVERGPERICISGGASQNVACILQSFTDPNVTQAVWCVAPCYHLVFQIFRDAGFEGRLKAFPEDEEGIDIEALEEKLAQFEENPPEAKPRFSDPGQYRKHYRHIIYVVPTCSNPSGKTMSLRRREALVRVARKYDALIICDDVYDFLQWRIDSDPAKIAEHLGPNEHPDMLLPRLCDIDLAMGQAENDPQGFGHAVSNGSFSKLVGPGVRTGWLEGSPAFARGLSQTGATQSGGSPSQFCASIMADLVKSGALQERLATTLRPRLQHRHRVLMQAIHKYLAPLGVGIREAGLVDGSVYGGYFVWLTLGPGISSKLVADAAIAEENLVVGNGTMFQIRGEETCANLNTAVRLTFSYVPEQDLVEGVERLAAVLQRVKADPAKYEALNGESDAVKANKYV